METQKNLLQVLGDWWAARHARQTVHEPAGQASPQRFNRTLRWLVPNGGTLLIVAVLLLTQSLWARPFQATTNAPGTSATTVNYQGRLGDNAGAPLDGTYGMTFALYDEATGGNLVWGPEEHTAVPVSDGLFSVGLGSKTDGGIPTTTWNGDRYLEITVGGETLTPRELIRSVPIAGMALTVPDGAIGSKQMAPTVFETRTESEIAIPVTGSTANFVALSLEVDFPVDANYLIMYKITSRCGVTGKRILTTLRDENFDAIGSSNSTIFQPHSHTDHAGSITSSATTVHFFTAGTHTINVIAWADSTTDAYIRTGSSIIAIPFAVTP